MKKTLLVFSFCLFSGLLNLAHAQSEPETTATDSTYDMGRVTVKKRNVQAVTIKAADLEKMPFTDLKDAINVYTNGVYSAHQRYVYVIDGILNTDVNALSIYDIDEITFVQNAATVMNGVDATGTLILIKTKRGGNESKGVTIAGKSEFIRLSKASTFNPNYPDPKTNDMYHQYYVSAYGSSGNVKAGVSAEILHNTIPYRSYLFLQAAPFAQRPIGTNRFKLNGFLDAKLGEKNQLAVNVGYVPQRDKTDQNGTRLTVGNVEYFSTFYNSQNLLYADVKLTSALADGLTNKLSAGFQKLTDHGEYLFLSYVGGAVQPASSRRDSTANVNSFVVKDDISYLAQLDNISIQPNLNFTFRQVDNPHTGQYGTNNGGGIYNFIDNGYASKQKLGILTPSITVSYQKWLTAQGGFQVYVNSNAPVQNADHGQMQPLPFANLNVDLFTALDADTNEMRLNLYGSYARNFNYSNDLYGSLMDQLYIHPGNNANFSVAPDPYRVFTQIQGGAVFSVFENKLSLSYSYSLKRFNAGQVVLILVPTFVDLYQNTDARVELHRVGVDFKMPAEGDFSWRTSLNGTYVYMRDSYKRYNYLPEYLRLTYPDKPFITGGFVNNLSFKDVYLDFGFVYGLNQAMMGHGTYSSTYLVTGKGNVFDLQNIDLGCKLHVKEVKNFEVYLNARNLLQSDYSKYTENRRYIGAGLKVGL